MITRTSCRRVGTAPLELALVFPILAILVAAMLWMGRGGSAKLAASANVRGQTWAGRTVANPEPVFQLDREASVGQIQKSDSVAIVGRGPVPGFPTSAQAELSTIFRTWDNTDFPIPPPPPAEQKIVVHIEELRKLMERNMETFAPVMPQLDIIKGTPAIDPGRAVRRNAR